MGEKDIDFIELTEKARSVLNPQKLSPWVESGGVGAVDWDGTVMPPCGRCREFLSQLAVENMETEVLVRENTVVKLKDLLPYDWREK